MNKTKGNLVLTSGAVKVDWADGGDRGGYEVDTCVVVVHIWSLQKHLNHMWEGTLTDVGLEIGRAHV